MGLPAAGKSTYIKQKFSLSDFKYIDADVIKASHPEYDPENPAPLHEWSKGIAEQLFRESIEQGDNIILDGTGTNPDKMVMRVHQLQAAGYEVTLVFVRCSLENSIKRNQLRDRTVPESLIRYKYQTILESFYTLSAIVDKVDVVDNDEEKPELLGK
jgi:predicted kinase